MRKRNEQRHVTFESLNMGIEEQNKEYKENKPSSSVHSIPTWVALIFVIVLLGLFALVYYLESLLPSPVIDQDNNGGRFVAENARNHLKILTDLGPRIVGSYENENITVRYLQQAIENITLNKHSSKNIEVDFQTVSGSYYLDYRPYGSVNCYRNVQNVVVKLSSVNTNNNNNSIFVNAHFDSVPTSPGGSDDGINIATMLEILRVLSESEDLFDRAIIFLFNGAEETPLQASHGFITQHKWARECKVVINLEGVGAGGKIVLFQTGPNNPWLVNKFVQVPHPTGHVSGEELFQSNLIPSDTDFRVFRDFGNVIGYDLAFIKNGYRYHTKYDGFDNIPIGSFQHVGDNILSLLKILVNSNEIDNLESQEQTKMIFYDFFGLFMISYKMIIAYVLNYLTALVCIAVAVKFFISLSLGSNKDKAIYILINFAGVLGGWLISIAFTVILALLLDAVGYTMSWYNNSWIIFGLYVAPVFGISCGSVVLANKFSNKKNVSIAVQTQTQLNCVRLIWTLVLIVGTALNIRTMVVIMIPLLFNGVVFAIIHFSKLQYSIRAWQIMHVVSLLIPVINLMLVTITLITFIIPITGRQGPSTNPEYYVGFITWGLTIFLTSFFVPLITLVRGPLKFVAGFFAVFILFFIFVFTPLGFPYSGNASSPAPQRFWIMHTSRLFYDENGTVRKQDAGFFIYNYDRNSPKSVENYVTDMSKVKTVETVCDREIFCGMPITNSRAINSINKSSWIPAEQPTFQETTSLTLQGKEYLNETLIRFNFSVSGPTHMSVYFALVEEATLEYLSLSDEVREGPRWGNRVTYYMSYTWGSKVPLDFYMTIRVPENWNRTVLDIIVLGRYVHDRQNVKTTHYQEFLGQFPEWADVTAWLASVRAYRF